MEIRDLCPLCNSESAIFYKDMYDDRFGYRGYFDVRKCNSCGFFFLDRVFSSEELIDLYSKYYPRREVDSKSVLPRPGSRGLREWAQGEGGAYTRVPPNVKILDIGCGLGESLLYHRNRGCEVSGVETDKNVLKVAQLHNLDLRVGVFASTLFPNEKFDYVTMDQVLEHVVSPIEFLTDVKNVLKPNGKIVISVPNVHGFGRFMWGRKWLHWHIPYHMHFFSKESLFTLAKKVGLRVISISYCTRTEWTLQQWLHSRLAGTIGRSSEFWTTGNSNTPFQPMVKLLHAVRLIHILTRLLDLLKIGDNLILEFEKSTKQND